MATPLPGARKKRHARKKGKGRGRGADERDPWGSEGKGGGVRAWALKAERTGMPSWATNACSARAWATRSGLPSVPGRSRPTREKRRREGE